MTIRIVGAGCFLYLSFSGPVVGRYKTGLALHSRDLLAGTEHGNLQGDRCSKVV